MEALSDPGTWWRLPQVVGVDLLLGADNALVIALAVRSLPPRHRRLGRLWGTGGVFAVRVALVSAVSLLLGLPFLYLGGGALLLWIALKLVLQSGGTRAPAGAQAASLWRAVGIIVLADATMSIDNVIAVAAAARGELALAIAGLALTIPLVVWSSGLPSTLMGRFPWIVWLGGGLLGWIAGRLLLQEPLLRAWLGEARSASLGVAVCAGLFALVAALGAWRSSRAHASPAHG